MEAQEEADIWYPFQLTVVWKHTISIKMARVVIFDGGKKDMSKFLGALVTKIIEKHPTDSPRILFPTGTTPLGQDGYFAELIRLRENSNVKTEGIRLVSGDEYHGIKPSSPGSFCSYLIKNVMTPLGLSVEESLQLNGGFIEDEHAADAECIKFENNVLFHAHQAFLRTR